MNAGISSEDGLLLVLAVMLPAVGLVAMFVWPFRAPERAAFLLYVPGLAVAIAVLSKVMETAAPLTYVLGGWAPPLGTLLRADGVAAMMLVVTALILGLVGLSAWPSFRTPAGERQTRRAFAFWALMLGLWSALNLAFLARDLFTLFVALELLTFAAVPLVALEGKGETLAAALRYLLFALAGSGLYLLGVALIYSRYATLDIGTLADIAGGGDALALGLMTAGLMAKTAVFPLHLWLPPAHAAAPAPASAVLSALVVKAPFLIIVRLWFELGGGPGPVGPASVLLAGLGAASILWCSVMALRQSRLKLMIAYSTVAQIGYLFLMFPLADAAQPALTPGWTGGMLQLVSHAFAKAAMFVAAGLIAEALGHDRIDDLAGAARAAPLSVAALALAGLSLVGLPPSGGFNAKAILLSAAVAQGQWWIAIVILAGGVLAAGYVFRAIGRATGEPDAGLVLRPVSRWREAVPLALALCALLLGFVPLRPLALFAIGAAP
ncbi:complex I subunit 5 family protein [Ancylobacter pratisalsi]|uniref:NADH-quinone oxidoreductase subunit J n=1 Tax=Ancylobacter pratisalsi TaxID=1745854 RepID=A0A6P1YLT7_9HYPH|nr:proton-conducting transporter membrane subunit [Ancylobacter pratisalsi]QIB33646.1 NADH-quinone oxidoreductase subunit J [Ancylobacter pratisalsi]